MTPEAKPITPFEIQTLRESYALNPVQFAKLVGVSLTTVYRWESIGETLETRMNRELSIEPLQCHLLRILHRIKIESRTQVGDKIALAITRQTKKPLYPMYVLLRSAFSPRTAKAA